VLKWVFKNIRKRLKIFENIRKLTQNIQKYSKIFEFFEGGCANDCFLVATKKASAFAKATADRLRHEEKLGTDS